MRYLIVLLIFLLSCNKTSVPKDIFPPQKMQEVLFDVIKADEWVDFSALQDSSYLKLSKRTALYDSIFHIHAITKEDFRKSYAYYQGRPDLLKEILDSLYSKTDTTIKKPVLKRFQDSVIKKVE